MLIINKSNHERIFFLILFQCVFSLPIGNIDNNFHSTITLETPTKKSFICPWYCYPIIIFAILAGLVIFTICLSACDYRYSKTKFTQQKPISLDEEKKTINKTSQKVLKKFESDDVISITSSNDSEKT
jgi:hypothetical protein